MPFIESVVFEREGELEIQEPGFYRLPQPISFGHLTAGDAVYQTGERPNTLSDTLRAKYLKQSNIPYVRVLDTFSPAFNGNGYGFRGTGAIGEAGGSKKKVAGLEKEV